MHSFWYTSLFVLLVGLFCPPQALAAGHTVSIAPYWIPCGGSCTGTLQAVVNGGNGPFTYVWSGGGTGFVQNGLCPGAYSVTVTDLFDNSTATALGLISSSSPITTTIAHLDPISCFGDCTASAFATVVNGTPPYSIYWTNTNGDTLANSITSSITANNLCAGTYYTTVVDVNGCIKLDTTIIIEPPPLVINLTVMQPVQCHGQCQGISMASVSGGLSPYMYNWSQGSTVALASELCGEEYQVTVTDASLCTQVATVLLAEPPAIELAFSKTSEACVGCCDATADVLPTGGVTLVPGLYSYLWDDASQSTAPTLQNLCAGQYNVVVTDDNNCSEAGFVVIEQCYYLSGKVRVQGTPADDTKLYLIKEISSELVVIDSITSFNGNYQFANVCEGTYHVLASLLPTSTSYGNFVPTYYRKGLFWNQSTAIVVIGNAVDIDINMTPATNLPSGLGLISGTVFYGAGSDTLLGTPVAGVRLILTNDTNAPISDIRTDSLGGYQFSGLPHGTYKIYPDMVNKLGVPHWAVLFEGNLSEVEKDFEVQTNNVIPIGDAVSVPEYQAAVTLEVFPNPFGDRITISSNDSGRLITSASLSDVLGREVATSPATYSDKISWDLGSLPNGMYLLHVHVGKGTYVKKLIKRL